MEKPIVQGYLDWTCEYARAIIVSSLHDGHKPGAGDQIELMSFRWTAERLSDWGFSPAPYDEATTEWNGLQNAIARL